jgi:hypothetical protein
MVAHLAIVYFGQFFFTHMYVPANLCTELSSAYFKAPLTDSPNYCTQPRPHLTLRNTTNNKIGRGVANPQVGI